jgi:hypothetical protein
MNRFLRPVSVSCGVFILTVLTSVPSPGQSNAAVANLRDQPFEANLSGATTLRLHLHDGDFRILGGDADKILIRAEGKNLAQARRIKIRMERQGNMVDLKLSHVPKNELQVTIAVPRTTDLFTRMRGGDLTVEGVSGNKDLRLTGGDLTIQVGSPADYGYVNLSVRFGDVRGDEFGDPKGWLGNSVRQEGTGKYRLEAHVLAGDLLLKP